MPWTVELADEFEAEFDALEDVVQDELRAHAMLLEQFGPTLGRPTVDTLKGARHANLKELRFDAANGVWRVAFACTSEKRFYRKLIRTADKRLDAHLARLTEAERNANEPRRSRRKK